MHLQVEKNHYNNNYLFSSDVLSIYAEHIKGVLCPITHNFLNVLHHNVTVITEKGIAMKEVFQEYGGVIITIVAIISLIAITSVVIGNEQGGVIKEAFTNIVTMFLQRANAGIR